MKCSLLFSDSSLRMDSLCLCFTGGIVNVMPFLFSEISHNRAQVMCEAFLLNICFAFCCFSGHLSLYYWKMLKEAVTVTALHNVLQRHKI